MTGSQWLLPDSTLALNETPGYNEGISVYPYPATSQISIRFRQPTPVSQIRVVLYNAMGTLVRSNVALISNSTASVNIDGLAPDLYYLIVSDKDKKQLAKPQMILKQ